MVSAWATMNHISLGQVVTDAKSNEITAIPKLLQILELSGALVAIISFSAGPVSNIFEFPKSHDFGGS